MKARDLDRWTYRKEGLDYGPFSTSRLAELVADGEVGPETLVRSERERRWGKVGDFPVLSRVVAQAMEKARRERERKRTLEEAESLERSVSRRDRAFKVAALAVPALVIGTAAWLGLRPRETPKDDLTLDVFREIRLDPLARHDFYPVSRTSRKGAISRRLLGKKRRIRRRAAVRQQVSGKDTGTRGDETLSATLEMDLGSGHDEPSTSRVLTEDDLEHIHRAATRRLLECFRAEAAQDPSFRGGTVVLLILPKGHVRLSQVRSGQGERSALVSCCARSVRGMTVEPFSGGAKVMEIPLYVAGVR